ncbi:hypothetical protein [Patulibacter medicamentivorans]|uniref:hypothetical protein n=1 Tax=Patulibacter medicamentivorans TaxID=1097667 RepID=UPI001110E0FD|nr:hypothetical protein [Patulibacter medicamentivorans]
MNRLFIGGVVLGTLAFAAPADAAVTVGSRLINDPANSGECAMLASPCTLAARIHPQDGSLNDAGAPVDGVVTRFRIKGYGIAGPATVRPRVVRLGGFRPGAADGAAGATGEPLVVPTDDDGTDVPVHAYSTRMTIRRGEFLGLDGTNVAATYNSSGDAFTYVFDPGLVTGAAARPSSSVTGELLVQADIEPDADRDGFGDETQDTCVASDTKRCSDSPRDTTAPGLTKARLRGRTLSFSISEAATVTVRIRRSGRTAAKRTVRVGAGAKRLTLPTRGLRRGRRYEVRVTAADPAGNVSKPKTLRFTVSR